MTDRLHRDRALPEGYQFGDAGAGARVILLEPDEWIISDLPPNTTFHIKGTKAHVEPWRAPHLNAAEQLQRRAGWNVIEGEDH